MAAKIKLTAGFIAVLLVLSGFETARAVSFAIPDYGDQPVLGDTALEIFDDSYKTSCSAEQASGQKTSIKELNIFVDNKITRLPVTEENNMLFFRQTVDVGSEVTVSFVFSRPVDDPETKVEAAVVREEPYDFVGQMVSRPVSIIPAEVDVAVNTVDINIPANSILPGSKYRVVLKANKIVDSTTEEELTQTVYFRTPKTYRDLVFVGQIDSEEGHFAINIFGNDVATDVNREVYALLKAEVIGEEAGDAQTGTKSSIPTSSVDKFFEGAFTTKIVSDKSYVEVGYKPEYNPDAMLIESALYIPSENKFFLLPFSRGDLLSGKEDNIDNLKQLYKIIVEKEGRRQVDSETAKRILGILESDGVPVPEERVSASTDNLDILDGKLSFSSHETSQQELSQELIKAIPKCIAEVEKARTDLEKFEKFYSYCLGPEAKSFSAEYKSYIEKLGQQFDWGDKKFPYTIFETTNTDCLTRNRQDCLTRNLYWLDTNLPKEAVNEEGDKILDPLLAEQVKRDYVVPYSVMKANYFWEPDPGWGFNTPDSSWGGKGYKDPYYFSGVYTLDLEANIWEEVHPVEKMSKVQRKENNQPKLLSWDFYQVGLFPQKTKDDLGRTLKYPVSTRVASATSFDENGLPTKFIYFGNSLETEAIHITKDQLRESLENGLFGWEKEFYEKAVQIGASNLIPDYMKKIRSVTIDDLLKHNPFLALWLHLRLGKIEAIGSPRLQGPEKSAIKKIADFAIPYAENVKTTKKEGFGKILELEAKMGDAASEMALLTTLIDKLESFKPSQENMDIKDGLARSLKGRVFEKAKQITDVREELNKVNAEMYKKIAKGVAIETGFLILLGPGTSKVLYPLAKSTLTKGLILAFGKETGEAIATVGVSEGAKILGGEVSKRTRKAAGAIVTSSESAGQAARKFVQDSVVKWIDIGSGLRMPNMLQSTLGEVGLEKLIATLDQLAGSVDSLRMTALDGTTIYLKKGVDKIVKSVFERSNTISFVLGKDNIELWVSKYLDKFLMGRTKQQQRLLEPLTALSREMRFKLDLTGRGRQYIEKVIETRLEQVKGSKPTAEELADMLKNFKGEVQDLANLEYNGLRLFEDLEVAYAFIALHARALFAENTVFFEYLKLNELKNINSWEGLEGFIKSGDGFLKTNGIDDELSKEFFRKLKDYIASCTEPQRRVEDIIRHAFGKKNPDGSTNLPENINIDTESSYGIGVIADAIGDTVNKGSAVLDSTVDDWLRPLIEGKYKGKLPAQRRLALPASLKGMPSQLNKGEGFIQDLVKVRLREMNLGNYPEEDAVARVLDSFDGTLEGLGKLKFDDALLFPTLQNKPPKVEILESVISETGEGASKVLYPRAKLPDGTEVTVEVYRNPRYSNSPSAWDELISYFLRELENFRELTKGGTRYEGGQVVDIGLEKGTAPRFYGIVDIGGNPAFAREPIKGKHPSQMSTRDVADFVFPHIEKIQSQLEKIADKLVDEGYVPIGKLRYVILTERQVINGIQKEVGDVVLADLSNIERMSYTPTTGSFHADDYVTMFQGGVIDLGPYGAAIYRGEVTEFINFVRGKIFGEFGTKIKAPIIPGIDVNSETFNIGSTDILPK